jgi:excisionase family DNA binding protein
MNAQQIEDMKPLTVPEVAQIMSRSQKSVRDLLNEGKLPGKRIGKYWYVNRHDLFKQLGISDEA